MLLEVAEMTMAYGLGAAMGRSVVAPHFAWSPGVIEDLPETERHFYLECLRATAKKLVEQ